MHIILFNFSYRINQKLVTDGCDHFAKKALFPVRSTLVNLRRAVLSSVVGDHMRNYGVAIFFFFLLKETNCSDHDLNTIALDRAKLNLRLHYRTKALQSSESLIKSMSFFQVFDGHFDDRRSSPF